MGRNVRVALRRKNTAFHVPWGSTRSLKYFVKWTITLLSRHFVPLRASSHEPGYRAGARLSKVPRTFQARKAIRKTTTYLFCKAGLLICCKGNRNKNNCKVSCLETPSFWRCKENYVTRNMPEMFRDFRETGPWPAKRDWFCLAFIWEISSRLPRWKNVQRATKIPARGPRSLKTLETSVSAKLKSVNKHGATKSGVRTPRVVSYRCYVATAEWLSSAVENTAGKAQCGNPVLFIAKAKLSFSKFEAKEADAFKLE